MPNPASKASQTAYHLALQYAHNKRKNIDDADSSPVSALPGTAAEIYKLLHEYFPVKYAGIAAQVWHDALCSKISQIDFNLFPQIEYDLEPLWRICPNVHRFIKDKGGDDQSPEAILAILDPETENEPEEFRHERKCLHKLLAKNFALYRLELAMAESFLIDEYRYKDAHPRGGKRPGTGGKRPGAGKKPQG